MPDFSDIFDMASIVELIKQKIIVQIMASYAALGNLNEANPVYDAVYGTLSKTPAQWNATVYGAVSGMAGNVLMSVAGVITAFVLVYDLMQSIESQNNMHESEAGMIIKWVIKAFIAVTLVSHSMEIVSAVFETASWVVKKAGEYLSTSSNLSFDDLSELFTSSLYEKSIPELLLIQGEINVSLIAVGAMFIIAVVVIWSRMIEIFMVIAASPIPLATCINREWSDVGRNYIKLIIAYALQAYLIMIVFAVYSALVKDIAYTESVTRGTITLLTYTFLFGFMFFKTESIAKSVCCAH